MFPCDPGIEKDMKLFNYFQSILKFWCWYLRKMFNFFHGTRDVYVPQNHLFEYCLERRAAFISANDWPWAAVCLTLFWRRVVFMLKFPRLLSALCKIKRCRNLNHFSVRCWSWFVNKLTPCFTRYFFAWNSTHFTLPAAHRRHLIDWIGVLAFPQYSFSEAPEYKFNVFI